MENNDLLTQNPFYILQATPRATDRELLDRASELFLLSGRDTKKEVNTLLQPSGRLRAEIAFLPRMKEEEIEEIRSYLDASEDPDMAVSVPLPSLETASSLARMNGLFALLEKWPFEDCEGAYALCICIADACTSISPEEVLSDLADDRREAEKGMAETSEEIRHRLQEHKKALFSRIGERSGVMPEKERQLLLQKLADTFADEKSPFYLSLVLNDLVRVYLSPLQKQWIQEQKNGISEILEELKTKGGTLSSDKRKKYNRELCSALERWDSLSFPERRILMAEGIYPTYVRDLFYEVDSIFISMVKEWSDITNAKLLIEKMLEVFTDIPEDQRNRLEKNAAIVKARPVKTR